MFDLQINGGKVVLEAGVQEANLYVNRGKIAAISTEEFAAAERIDASGLLVFPGGVDPHVHLNDPGYTAGEDFYTGTAAAAAGGITTIMEMPLTDPVTADEGSFALKRAEAAKKAVIDYGLYMALVPDNIDRVDELMRLRPIAFKAFMSYSPEIEMLTDGLLFAGMRHVSRAGGRLALHCENNDIINFLTAELRDLHRKDPLAYAQSRPAFAEAESVQRAVRFAIETGVRLHVVHSSTPEGCRVVSAARDRGHPVSVETAPHFLLLSTEDLIEQGPYAQCNPPLRDEANIDRMWRTLEAGDIDCIGSDHAPYTLEEKAAGLEDIWKAPAGLNCIQTMIPMTLAEGLKRGIPPERFAQLFATKPAKLFGLYPEKGAIRVGGDADLFLFDTGEAWVVDEKNLFYKQPWTPYLHRRVRGRVKRTVLRGKTVFDDELDPGRVLVEPGSGAFLPGRPLSMKATNA